ncbi:MAG: S-layer homology domain-containing protein [Clostridia bacterium]|nr:S-layer homology domain-containing protein [Clostridia bacterium]
MTRFVRGRGIIIILLLLVVLVGSVNASANRFNMSYLYGNYDYASLVERTNGALSEVSPSYFDLYEDGSLKLNKVDTTFVSKMHAKGVKVVPFLSNHWDRSKGRAALKNMDKLATQIANAISKYNLDGVNVDIENLNEADRDAYTKLVRLLREKLPADKSISVAVAANPYGLNVGWQGSYDYKELGKYADYLMIMAYDEHYESGPTGAVASIDFVERSIKYAISQVDKEKVVLGLPFYGRYWQDGYSYGGYGVSLTRVDKIIKTYTTKTTYDERAQAVKSVVKINDWDTKPVINGRTLYSGTYTFWYENEKSIKAKLELVNKYEIKGTGSWSLGQELAETWEYYDETLIKMEEPLGDEWAIPAIEYVMEKGLMQGKSTDNFAAKDDLTRAEFATIISRMLSLDSYSYKSSSYDDISNHWAKRSIQNVTAAGLMRGYGDNTFKPNENIKREEVAKVLAQLCSDKENVTNIEFSDVSKDRWSYSSIKTVAEKGIMNGYPSGKFIPENQITRQEMAVILQRINEK